MVDDEATQRVEQYKQHTMNATTTCKHCGQEFIGGDMKWYGTDKLCKACDRVPHRVCRRCNVVKFFGDEIQGWSRVCNDCMTVVLPIPEAPDYGIEPNGSVWRYRTGRRLRPNKAGAVVLRMTDGRIVCRSAIKLGRLIHGQTVPPPPPPIFS